MGSDNDLPSPVNAIQTMESIMRLTIHKKSLVIVLCAIVYACNVLAERDCPPLPSTCEDYPKIEGQLQDPSGPYENACDDFWSADLADSMNICAHFIYSPPANASLEDSTFRHYWSLFVETSLEYRFPPVDHLDSTDMDDYLSQDWVLCGGTRKSTIIEMHDDSLFCLFTTASKTITNGSSVQHHSPHVSVRTDQLQRGSINLLGRELGKEMRAPGINLYRWRQLTVKKR